MYSIKHDRTKGLAAERSIKYGPNNDIFTPPSLADAIYKVALSNWKYCEDYHILDPCCGEGALIEPFYRINPERIIAIDINQSYIEKCKQDYPNAHFSCTDFLFFNTAMYSDLPRKYDIIIMNPPFSLQKGNCRVPFWDHALSMLKDDGVIVSVCPDYYLINSEMRKKIYANNIKESYILPKFLFETNADKKGKQPLHTHLVVLVKECENTTFLFV